MNKISLGAFSTASGKTALSSLYGRRGTNPPNVIIHMQAQEAGIPRKRTGNMDVLQANSENLYSNNSINTHGQQVLTTEYLASISDIPLDGHSSLLEFPSSPFAHTFYGIMRL